MTKFLPTIKSRKEGAVRERPECGVFLVLCACVLGAWACSVSDAGLHPILDGALAAADGASGTGGLGGPAAGGASGGVAAPSPDASSGSSPEVSTITEGTIKCGQKNPCDTVDEQCCVSRQRDYCQKRGSSCSGSVRECDDNVDCTSASLPPICCVTVDATGTRTACLDPGDCQATNGSPVCRSPADCPAGYSACLVTPPAAYATCSM